MTQEQTIMYIQDINTLVSLQTPVADYIFGYQQDQCLI